MKPGSTLTRLQNGRKTGTTSEPLQLKPKIIVFNVALIDEINHKVTLESLLRSPAVRTCQLRASHLIQQHPN